jgi:hypothetical protein
MLVRGVTLPLCGTQSVRIEAWRNQGLRRKDNDGEGCQGLCAEHNDNQLYVLSKVLDAHYNEQEMFYELLVAWRGFRVGEAAWEPYSVMAVDVSDMVTKFMESHEDIDAVREMRSL